MDTDSFLNVLKFLSFSDFENLLVSKQFQSLSSIPHIWKFFLSKDFPQYSTHLFPHNINWLQPDPLLSTTLKSIYYIFLDLDLNYPIPFLYLPAPKWNSAIVGKLELQRNKIKSEMNKISEIVRKTTSNRFYLLTTKAHKNFVNLLYIASIIYDGNDKMYRNILEEFFDHLDESSYLDVGDYRNPSLITEHFSEIINSSNQDIPEKLSIFANQISLTYEGNKKAGQLFEKYNMIVVSPVIFSTLYEMQNDDSIYSELYGQLIDVKLELAKYF